jgi:HAD superfamily hydrolase (TIGR01549 family)
VFFFSGWETKMTRYKTIAFDCFGTMAYIARPAHVFGALARRGIRGSVDPRMVMCFPWTLTQAAHELGIEIEADELAQMESALSEEVASITLYPETREVLTHLRDEGYQIAVCSNLALPYAKPVQAQLGDLLDIEVWSFEVGALKPSPDIYSALLARAASAAHETLMVGDSATADYAGARNSGLEALHLVREGVLDKPHQISALTGVLAALG